MNSVCPFHSAHWPLCCVLCYSYCICVVALQLCNGVCSYVLAFAFVFFALLLLINVHIIYTLAHRFRNAVRLTRSAFQCIIFFNILKVKHIDLQGPMYFLQCHLNILLLTEFWLSPYSMAIIFYVTSKFPCWANDIIYHCTQGNGGPKGPLQMTYFHIVKVVNGMR